MDEIQEACEVYRPPNKVSQVKSGKNSRKKRCIPKVNVTPEKDHASQWEQNETYQREWLNMEAKLMQLTSEFFHKYVEKLYNFIERYSKESPLRPLDEKHSGFNYGLLPTAMLSLNSNMTQIRITNEIEEMFTNSKNDVTILRLNRFNLTNMNALFQAFHSTLLDDATFEQSDKKSKNMCFDEIFQLWLDKISPFSQNKNKKNSNNSLTSLVIFVHEFENVNKQNLVKLILILKEYVKEIPILLVFLIHNHLNSSIQNFLPAHASDNLIIEDLEPFYEPKLIPQLLEEFISNPGICFKIHPDLIKEIYIYFTNYEFSFSNFLFLLKSLVFDYYYENPLSVICQFNGDVKKILPTDKRLLDLLRNSLPLSENSKTDDEFVDRLIDAYKDLLAKHAEFAQNLKIIIEVLSICCGETKGFLSLYCEMVNVKHFDFKGNLLSGLFRVYENVWSSALKKVNSKFKDNADNELMKLLASYQHKLEDILNKEREEEEMQLKSQQKLNLECDIVDKVKVLKNKLRNLNSRSEWKQSIAPKKDNKEVSLFDKWKTELIDSIHSILQRTSPSKHRHLIDSLFYNNKNFIPKHHFICVREDIDQSLLNQSNRSFKNIYPNSFILYQLYSGESSIINLQDWFEQFSEEKKHSKKNISKNELIVHFSNTLADFDFIGLMQSSRYKADYLNKLVWL